MLYKHQGVPVKLSIPKWICTKIKASLLRGSHKSYNNHIYFLKVEFVDIIKKGKWVIFPVAMAM